MLRPLILCLAISISCFGQDAGTQPSTQPTTAPTHEDPTLPAMKGGAGAQRFVDMHQRFLERKSQGPIDLLFIGDSITEGWNGDGKPIWDQEYAADNVANFGIGGDRTQNVLWRIENGELDELHPQLTVVLIGTNNVFDDSASQIAAADAKIVHEILDKTGSRVLLLGIFPRSHPHATAEVDQKIATINQSLSKLDNGTSIRYLDITKAFVGEDGKVPTDVMPDGLHPNRVGYKRWANAMRPLLTAMFKKPTTKPTQD